MDCISDFLGDKPYMMGDRVTTTIQYVKEIQTFPEYQGPFHGLNMGLRGSNQNQNSNSKFKGAEF